MTNQISSEIVWQALEKELFAVLGMVTTEDASRTVGIVYTIEDRKFFIGTGLKTWKARHIIANPAVSLTVPIPKRVPIAPWIKVPQATVTFSGSARIIPCPEADPDLLRKVFRHYADDPEFMKDNCLIEVTPQGEFLTYGVGIPLMKMRHPHLARGRALVSE